MRLTPTARLPARSYALSDPAWAIPWQRDLDLTGQLAGDRKCIDDVFY
ncbi:MAG: hypothetical protein ABI551_07530 [Polyangiaceae bacterium]